MCQVKLGLLVNFLVVLTSMNHDMFRSMDLLSLSLSEEGPRTEMYHDSLKLILPDLNQVC